LSYRPGAWSLQVLPQLENPVSEEANMKAFRKHCQHIFNPLHVYCRLRQLGFTLGLARNVCRAYERGLYRFIL
jgi:hypothetical protein